MNQHQREVYIRQIAIRGNQESLRILDRSLARPNLTEAACLIAGITEVHPMDDEPFDENDFLTTDR